MRRLRDSPTSAARKIRNSLRRLKSKDRRTRVSPGDADLGSTHQSPDPALRSPLHRSVSVPAKIQRQGSIYGGGKRFKNFNRQGSSQTSQTSAANRRLLSSHERAVHDAAAKGDASELGRLLNEIGNADTSCDVDAQEWSPERLSMAAVGKSAEAVVDSAAHKLSKFMSFRHKGPEQEDKADLTSSFAAQLEAEFEAEHNPTAPVSRGGTSDGDIDDGSRVSASERRRTFRQALHRRHRKKRGSSSTSDEAFIFADGREISSAIEISRDGETALHKAVRFGHVEAAECLLEHGASTRIQDDAGREPWYYAAFSELAPDGTHAELARLLYRYESHPTPDLLLLASFSVYPGVFEAMLDQLRREVVTRKSRDDSDKGNNCVLHFYDLHLLDDNRATHRVQFEDGTTSKPGWTPYLEVVRRSRSDPICSRAMTHPSMQALLYYKWSRGGRLIFICEFSAYIVMLVCLAVALAIRTTDIGDSNENLGYHQIIFVLELIAAIAACLILPSALLPNPAKALLHIVRHPLSAFFWRGHRLLVTLGTLVGVAMCWRGHARDNAQYARPLLISFAFLQVLQWCGLLPYLKVGSRKIGTFMIVVERVLRDDLRLWMSVLFLFWPGLSLSLSLLAKASTLTHTLPREQEFAAEDYRGWDNALVTLWMTMFGLHDWNRNNDEPATIAMVCLVTLTLNVVAVNMLIAMVNSTYQLARVNAEREWISHWAHFQVNNDGVRRHVVRRARRYGCRQIVGAPSIRQERDKDDSERPFEWKGLYSEMFIVQPPQAQGEVLGTNSAARQAANLARKAREEDEQVKLITRAIQYALIPVEARLTAIESDIAALRRRQQHEQLSSTPPRKLSIAIESSNI